MSAATPAPIWWCTTHDSGGGGEPGTVAAMVGCFAASVGHGDPAECQHERMKMVSYSALVVERDADGNWKLPQDTDRDKWHHGLIASVLDDLAAAEAYR